MLLELGKFIEKAVAWIHWSLGLVLTKAYGRPRTVDNKVDRQ